MAQHHPHFPQEPAKPAHAKFIYPLIALETDAASARILDLLKSQFRRSHYKENDGSKALTQALVALNDKAAEHYRKAQRHGELLLCWHGTKSTTVPAEGGAA